MPVLASCQAFATVGRGAMDQRHTLNNERAAIRILVMRIPRDAHLGALEARLRRFPVVALLGARQVGKTTLARELAGRRERSSVFDLERSADLSLLADAELALRDLRGLVVLDEVQRRPDLFSTLRVLADRRPLPARFLVLGSASPELLRQSAESLAGRIAFQELPPLSLSEVGAARLDKLWLRGGFPRSYTARSDAASFEWRQEFARTFLERDLAQLGTSVPAATMGRFWAMLAQAHGNLWNGAEFGRAFGVAHTTVTRYLDLLSGALVVRQLPPWSENISKRQVKSPKVYVADSGLLHALLDVRGKEALLRHPKVGASWEGFGIQAVIDRLGARREECFFWATYAGAELDLLVVRGTLRLGFEFKRTVAPTVTPSMRIAQESLRLKRVDVVHAGERSADLGRGIRAVSLARLLEDLDPLP
jgi:predicted AAA+ superfamily ATPase